MRARGALVLLIGVAGCTGYHPVGGDGRGGWTPARSTAIRGGSGAEAAGGPIPAAGGDRHVVLPGETLSDVTTRYGTGMAALADRNGVAPPYVLYAGQVLAIPDAGARPRTAVAVAEPRRQAIAARGPPVPLFPPVRVASLEEGVISVRAPASPPDHQPGASRLPAHKAPPPLSGDGFLWPVQGTIASSFGAKPNGARNNGVDIRAPEGTPIRAAENGVVVYAGDAIPGYGRMLLISHADGFTTAYAHNSKLLVAVGAVVERGQAIARVGRTGDVTSPQLHFELRDGKEPLDPAAHLAPDVTRLASRT